MNQLSAIFPDLYCHNLNLFILKGDIEAQATPSTSTSDTGFDEVMDMSFYGKNIFKVLSVKYWSCILVTSSRYTRMK